LEENQVITIHQAMIALVQDYVGEIDTASLQKKEPGKSYTSDSIKIKGTTTSGRRFCMELTLEDD
jgi:hypothetical protein